MTNTTATLADRRNEMLDGWVCDAHYAIHYWAVAVETAGPSTAFREFDERTGAPTGEIHRLNRALLRRGVKRLLSGQVKINPTILGWIAADWATGEGCQSDGDAVDCIVQAGALGEIRYG